MKTPKYVLALNSAIKGCASKSVVVFVLPGCPHCKAALQYLADNGVQHVVVPKASVPEEFLSNMAASLNFHTYPRVFVRGDFKGGNDDLRRIPLAEIKA